jgi:hypothetical protein
LALGDGAADFSKAVSLTAFSNSSALARRAFSLKKACRRLYGFDFSGNIPAFSKAPHNWMKLNPLSRSDFILPKNFFAAS